MFPLTSVIDTFNRPDEDPVTGYTRIFGTARLQVTGNALAATGGIGVRYLADGGFPSNDQEAFASISTVSFSVGDTVDILVRSNGTTYYYAELAVVVGPAFAMRLFSDAGAISSAVPCPTPQAGSVFGIRINSTTIQAWLGGNLILSADDNLIASGSQIGVGLGGTAFQLDNFGGGNVVYERPMISSHFSVQLRAS
jgi:hypothetical protein